MTIAAAVLLLIIAIRLGYDPNVPISIPAVILWAALAVYTYGLVRRDQDRGA